MWLILPFWPAEVQSQVVKGLSGPFMDTLRAMLISDGSSSLSGFVEFDLWLPCQALLPLLAGGALGSKC